MSEPKSKDRQYGIFFGVVMIVAIWAAVISFGSGSFSTRAAGGIVLGPAMICYAFYGLSRGRFPELSKSVRSINRLQFWFCFWAFLIVGGAVTLLGLNALAAR